ncbi:MAG: adenosylmethionine decarboxylase [Hyphomicrobium sp.]|uniref:adenosylmethionine decarboxylase n=1 Tax=Hyphomicrobium sp. TaxID=82 RepID=UPI003D1151AE
MAFNDTLFQLGMDLTRSSPAQKEDLHASQSARAALEDTTGNRGASSHAGQHLIIDLFGARRLDDVGHVERVLKRCVEASGATLLHMHLHPLKPTGGVTGVAVLEESHIAIHSWPKDGYAALDVFMSGPADAARVVPVLKKAFEAREVRVTAQLRGAAPKKTGKRKDKAKAGKKPAAAARPRAIRKANAA